MRNPRPWLRKQNKTWYVMIDGKQHNLGKDAQNAQKKFHALMANRGKAQASNASVCDLLETYWEWCLKNRAESTCERRKPVLTSFGKFVGKRLKGQDLKPYHVQRWLDKHYPKAGPTYTNTLITTIKGAIEWSASMGYLEHSPISKMKKPTPVIRQTFVPSNTWGKVLELATDLEFRDFLAVMLSTGARPQEMFILESDHLQGARFILPITKSKGKKKSRVIYIPSDCMGTITRLAKENPSGPMFRNSKGEPWNRNSVRCRFRRLKRELKMPDLTATSLRHSFAHYRLVTGQDSHIVSKLMGHVDGRMLSQRYGHIEANSEFMQEQSNRTMPLSGLVSESSAMPTPALNNSPSLPS